MKGKLGISIQTNNIVCRIVRKNEKVISKSDSKIKLIIKNKHKGEERENVSH